MSIAGFRPGCSARRHGDASAYTRYGCRCADAREANRLYAKRGRESRRPAGWIDSVGPARRLQALAVIGWGLDALSERSGLSRAWLDNLRAQRRGTKVTRRTAETVAALYEELQTTPGPASRAAWQARGRGWAPPLAWVDIDDPKAEPDWTRGVVRWSIPHPAAASRAALDLARLAHAGELADRARDIAAIAAREPARATALILALADMASAALPTLEDLETLQAAYDIRRREYERLKKQRQRQARAG